MWLATQEGFYSIVQHKDLPDTFMVRSRHKVDLENLTHLILKYGWRLDPIVETPSADYPYRIIVNTSKKTRIVMALAEGIDYSNFKDRVHKRPDQANKNGAYMEIWSVMRRTEARYSRVQARRTPANPMRSALDDYDEEFDPFHDDREIHDAPETTNKAKAKTGTKTGTKAGR